MLTARVSSVRQSGGAGPIGTRKVGSWARIGAGPFAAQGLDERRRDPLDLVGPLEDGDVAPQVPLADPAERPQEVAQPRPHPLTGVVVHLAHTVPVVVPRPLPRPRRVPAC